MGEFMCQKLRKFQDLIQPINYFPERLWKFPLVIEYMRVTIIPLPATILLFKKIIANMFVENDNSLFWFTFPC